MSLRPNEKINMTDFDDELQSSEGYEHYRWTVDKGQTPLRIDKFLTARIENTTRTKVQHAADAGCVLVNGNAVKSNYKIKPLDDVSVVMPQPPRDTTVIPEDIPLHIVFEDDHLLVVNKAAGMVVHPGHGNYTGTMVNALTFHLSGLPLFRSGEMRPGLVHRIDKDTSGILVIAKTEKALNHLSRQFFEHTIDRRYLALVWGNLPEDTGVIRGNIGRDPKDRLQMRVFEDESDGKPAVTHYHVTERFGYVTLVECRLETGRTHQIRAHFRHIGYPLFNDARYGGNQILKGTVFSKYRQFVENCFSLLPRQALHARLLAFDHPETGQRMTLASPLPDDMAQVIEKWRKYAVSSK
jgi:23S rRNA pseudouridine1911/1915/1917 synthase